MNKNTSNRNLPSNAVAIAILDIEQALSTQGHFCLLDWLISENHLLYGDYEKWRYGEFNHLDTQIKLDKKNLRILAKSVNELATKLQLEAVDEDYFSWRENKQGLLKASKHPELHRALTQHWQRHQDVPQMDLFMDNTANITENSILNTLAARNYQEAQGQLDKLTQLNSAHEKLGHYQDLINYGYHMENLSVEAEYLSAEIQALENEVLPLAKSVLKHQARDYLASAWRRLAKNMQKTFDPANDKLHASYALIQIPDWQASLNSLNEVSKQFEDPVLLQRSARCYEAIKEENKALLCWCLLMELDADRGEAAIEQKTSKLIWPLWQDFWDIENGEEMSAQLFPAYVFTQHSGLIHHLNKVPAMTHPATLAVIEGIRLRHANEDDIPARKKMQAISPSLLRLFLAM